MTTACAKLLALMKDNEEHRICDLYYTRWEASEVLSSQKFNSKLDV